MTKPILLIDADGLLITSALKAQTIIDWEDDVYSVAADLAAAKANFDSQIDAIMSASGPNQAFYLCFSDKTKRYFRHDIFPEYKQNRKGGIPPLGINQLREWAKETFYCREKPSLEADDVLGILGTGHLQGHKFFGKGVDPIMVSVDKDLLQIPGLHLNPMALDEGVFEVGKEEAERHMWFQTLTGDSVDGYPGCPKVGPVGANKILDKAVEDGEEFEVAVREAYRKHGSSVEEMVVQLNVARILQTRDYDFKKRKPVLWPLKKDNA